MSEQKRRTLIRTGFDALCHLVPGLKSGSSSKSVILERSVQFMAYLQRRVEGLQALVEGLSARVGERDGSYPILIPAVGGCVSTTSAAAAPSALISQLENSLSTSSMDLRKKPRISKEKIKTKTKSIPSKQTT